MRTHPFKPFRDAALLVSSEVEIDHDHREERWQCDKYHVQAEICTWKTQSIELISG